MNDEETSIWNRLPTEIWYNVFDYLPRRDLSQMRVVNRHFLALVSSTPYYSKVKFRLNSGNIESIYNRLATEYGEERKGLFQNLDILDLKREPEWLEVIEQMGSNVKCLKLMNSILIDKWCTTMPNVTAITFSLMDDPKLLESFDLKNFKNLKSVDISCNRLAGSIRSTLMSQLSQTPNELKLEEICLEHRNEEDELCLNILLAHAETLQRVSVHCFSAPLSDTYMWGSIFKKLTKLKSVKLTGCIQIEYLAAVYDSIPATAPIHQADLAGNIFIEDDLLNRIITKWSHSLEEIDLMFCVQLTDEGLRQLSKVRHRLQSLNISFCRKFSSLGLLSGIACERNTMLTSLQLKDLQHLTSDCVLKLAENLPNLKILGLECCPNAVNDNVLNHIFQYQTQLRCLYLDDCNKITDDGFLGCGNTPYSINRLQGLQVLSIRGCRLITNRSLIALQLKELRKLRIGYSHRVSTSGIEKLVKECSSIEKLILCSCLMIDDKSIYHITKGLKRLLKLNISNCLNITNRSIDYIIEFCTNLRELSVSGIYNIDMDDVQKRFVTAQPYKRVLIY